MTLRVFSLHLSLAGVLACSPPALMGQSLAGTVVGRIVDPTGLPVAEAQVRIRSDSTNREYSSTTDQSGYYSVTGLAPGLYQLRIAAPGFSALVDPRIDVTVSQEVRADAKLAIGSTEETVIVQASHEVLETENGQRGDTIYEREIRDLPLNGRNYLSLALLVPGVVPAAAGQNPHNINGSRPDHIAYLLEGLPNSRRRDHEQVVLPSLEAVQEFKLLTGAHAPEYGRMEGVLSWSKAIDSVSFGSAARQPQNSRDLRAERGRADFDRRAVWTSDVIYDLPIGRRRAFSSLPNWLNAAVGDWRLSVITQAYSGAPFTPTQIGNSQQGAPTRPDRIAVGEAATLSVDRWFDASAFSVVPLDAFRYGNSGRNILSAPGYLNFDAAIEKDVIVGEGRSLQLRGEFFNALNRANFGPPAAAVDQPTAGIISSAASGRQVQLGLKFLF
jgi:hypothetical protein